MAVRCVGAEFLRTASALVLGGNSPVSVSFWVQLNPGSGVASDDSTVLGSGANNLFSAAVVGGTSAALLLKWATAGSLFEYGIASNDPVHVAMTYESGLQQYFINGLLAGTGSNAAALGPVVGSGTPGCFQIGSTVAGVDLTVDEPTVWQGYRLSQQDAVNLRDRVVHPQGVSPPNIVWQPELNGPGGKAAVAGDPALADLGPSRLSLVTLSTPAPSYVAGVLLYNPQVTLGSAAVGTSGTTLALQFAGRNGVAPLTAMNTSGIQTVRVTGMAGTFLLGFQEQPAGPLAAGRPPGVVQAALEALPVIGKGNVQVSGFGPYRVQFTGSLAGTPQPAITVNGSSLLGSLPTTPATPGTTTTYTQGGAVGVTRTDPPYVAGSGTWSKSGYNLTYFLPSGSYGANYAAWEFPGLAPGLYSLAALAIPAAMVGDPSFTALGGTPSGVYAPAASATYRVYDGLTLDVATYRGSYATSQVSADAGTFLPLLSAYCASGKLWLLVGDDTTPDASGHSGVVASNATCVPYDPALAGAPVQWPFATDASLSVYARVKFNTLANGVILGWGVGSGVSQFLDLRLNAGKLQWVPGHTSWAVADTSTLTAGVWYDVVVTSFQTTPGTTDQNTVKFYVNGVLGYNLWYAEMKVTGTAPGGAIGRDAFPGGPFAIAPSDVTISRGGVWNRALTAVEAAALTGQPFTALTGGLPTGLVSWYDLDLTGGADRAGYATPSPLATTAAPVPSGAVTPGASVAVTLPGGYPTYSRDGGTTWQGVGAPIMQPGTEPGVPAQPYVVHLLPTKVNQNDVVKLSFATGAYNCGGGVANDVPGVAAMTVANNTGVDTLPDLPPPVRTLGLGYGAWGGTYYGRLTLYANLCKNAAEWNAPWGDFSTIALDADHYPVPASFAAFQTASGAPYMGLRVCEGDPHAYPGFVYGRYTLLYDGTGTLNFWKDAGRVGLVGFEDVGHDFNNKIVCDFPPVAGQASPDIWLYYYGGATTNYRLYDSTIPDPLNPPKWHPTTLSRLAGAKSLRTMEFGSSLSGIVDESDFGRTTVLSASQDVPKQRSTISRLEPYPYSPTNPFSVAGSVHVLVTFSDPTHPFKTGHRPSLTGDLTQAALKNAAGGDAGSVWQSGSLCYWISTTQVVLYEQRPDFVARTCTGLYLYNPTYVLHPSEMIDLANTAGCDLHWNIQHGMSDACVTAMAALFATTLVGNLYQELDNEHWNTDAIYGYFYYLVMGLWIHQWFTDATEATLTGNQAYALDSGRKYALVKAEYDRVSRSGGCKHYLGAMYGMSNIASEMIDYCKHHDARGRLDTGVWSGPILWDGLLIAPYLQTGPSQGVPVAVLDALTLEQTMDVGDAFYANLDTLTPADNGHLALIAATNPGAKLVAYECGPMYMGLGQNVPGMDVTLANNRSAAVGLHPRFRRQMLRYFAWLQKSFDLVYIQSLGEMLLIEGVFLKNYGVYKGLNHAPGNGDGSDGLPNNLPAIVDGVTGLAKYPYFEAASGGNGMVVSPYGRAAMQWQAKSVPTPAKTSSPPRRLLQHPGRGRRFH